MKVGSELHQVIKFPVCPWSSFCLYLFPIWYQSSFKDEGRHRSCQKSPAPPPPPPVIYHHCTMAISIDSLHLKFLVSPAVLKFESRPVFQNHQGKKLHSPKAALLNTTLVQWCLHLLYEPLACLGTGNLEFQVSGNSSWNLPFVLLTQAPGTLNLY